MSDVMATFNTVKYARGRVRRWMKPDRRDGVVPFNLFGARVEVQRMPKGVVGILGPWNVPLFTTLAPLAPPVVAQPQTRSAEPAVLPDAIADALGGNDNVRTVRALHGRYRVELNDAARIDEGALAQLTRGIVRPQPGICHILI